MKYTGTKFGSIEILAAFGNNEVRYFGELREVHSQDTPLLSKCFLEGILGLPNFAVSFQGHFSKSEIRKLISKCTIVSFVPHSHSWSTVPSEKISNHFLLLRLKTKRRHIVTDPMTY